MDMLAVQVSAMLYLAVVSWLSIHFKLVSPNQPTLRTSRTHLLHFEALELNHYPDEDAEIGVYGLRRYRTLSVEEKTRSTS